MEDNKTGVSTDLFGKERGECEVQTCGCKQFTVDKHSYNCKECLHPAKYHINLGKKLTTKPEDKLMEDKKAAGISARVVERVEVHFQTTHGKKSYINGLAVDYVVPAEQTFSSLYKVCLQKTGWSAGRMLLKKEGCEVRLSESGYIPSKLYFRKGSSDDKAEASAHAFSLSKPVAEFRLPALPLQPQRPQKRPNASPQPANSDVPEKRVFGMLYREKNGLSTLTENVRLVSEAPKKRSTEMNRQSLALNPASVNGTSVISKTDSRSAQSCGQPVSVASARSPERERTSEVESLREKVRQLTQEKELREQEIKIQKKADSLMVIDKNDVKVLYGNMIGLGASATVYKATVYGKERAVKVIKEPMDTESIISDDEVQFMLKASHSNIVNVLGVVQLGLNVGVVMELASGDLEKFIQSRSTRMSGSQNKDFSIKMGYSLDIAKAVDFLHQKDLVHQDIKPLNVLLFNGVAKLADLGFTAFASSMRTATAGGHSGTIVYMAPELLLTRCRASKSTDVWSFGVTLHELFAGGRAWGSQVVKLPGGPRVPKEVKMGALPATHRLIDERIRHHVAHMMSYDPKSRPTSCEVVEIMRKIQ